MNLIEEAQKAIGYTFQKPALLGEALTHRSRHQGKQGRRLKDNERFEFLGDAVLGLIISEYLANAFPILKEGDLSHVRARLVRQSSLAKAAGRINIGVLLQLGRGEELNKGRQKSSLLANALEAVIAAIYLDGGLIAARSFVLKTLNDELEELQQISPLNFRQDYKSQLQEWCQQQHVTLPEYQVVKESGPDHQKLFEVDVRIQGLVKGQGVGQNRKWAEQIAAKQALQELEELEDDKKIML